MPRPRKLEARTHRKVVILSSLDDRVLAQLKNGRAFGRPFRHGDYADLVSILLSRWLSAVEEPVVPLNISEL